MSHLVLVTDRSKREAALQLLNDLKQRGFTLSVVSEQEALPLAFSNANVVLFDLALRSGPLHQTILSLKKSSEAREIPVMALVSKSALSQLAPEDLFDDFLVEPFNSEELRLRVQKLLGGKDRFEEEERLLANDLVMNTATYEVFLSGRPIDLTYKEYELLRFLFSHPGRVFSREALLRQVWGYDFYGGTRTVDVHIRRLRSKLEDSGHSFIETVRNVGYRFRGKAESKE